MSDMEINIKNEALLTLSQASALIPKRRGRRVAATTLWRWIVHGSRGIRLEGLRQPGGWLTSAEAVQRFLERLAARETGQPPPKSPSWHERQRVAIERLRKAGIIRD